MAFSPEEAEKLRAIETHLRLDDPDFVSRISGERLARPPGRSEPEPPFLQLPVVGAAVLIAAVLLILVALSGLSAETPRNPPLDDTTTTIAPGVGHLP